MGKVIWLQLQIWTQMFLILKKLINKTFYLITFLWITDQGMTITTILNLLHLVYKYVVLFCESSSADTACKFLEVFLVQRWQNYFRNMLKKSQRIWTSTIWNYTCSMLAKKVGCFTMVQMHTAHGTVMANLRESSRAPSCVAYESTQKVELMVIRNSPGKRRRGHFLAFEAQITTFKTN